MSLELLIVILAASSTLILGLFTYYNQSSSATNKLFLLFTVCLSGYLLVNYLSSHQADNTSTFFWVKNIISIASLINLTFLLLVTTFPASQIQLKKYQIISLSVISFIIIFTTHNNLVFSNVTLTSTGTNSTPGPAMPLFLLQTLGFLGMGFASLFKKLKHSSGIQHQQIKILLYSTLVLFALIIVTNLLFVLILNTSAFVSLLPIYIVLFVGTISYTIIKYNFLDINLLVARTVAVTVLIALITVIYAIGVFAITQFVPESFQTIVMLILALIVTFTYNPIKQFVQKSTNNFFYKQPYSSDQLLEDLGHITRSTLSTDRLTKKIMETLHTTMHVNNLAFIIFEEENSHIVRSMGYETSPTFSKNNLHNLSEISKQNLVIFQQLEESAYKMLLRDLSVSIVISLRVKNHNHGLLLLGDKSSGESYSQQDIDVLEIFAPQISVAIQNAKSYEEIKHFADTLKEEVNRATKELRSANRHLKHLDKLKNDFIFVATHELKNPVTAMRGYLSMLNEGLFGQIPSKMKEPIDQLNATNQQLVELVNDLLQIARSEAKSVTIKPETIDLCETIDAVCGNLKSLLDQKHLHLNHSCPVPQKLQVTADPIRLKEIINNLVGNAIKYSDKGTIEITHELKDGLVITHVKDEGVGIAKEDQKKLFTRFFRVEEQAAKGIPGTGLGLYIIKQYVEKMGGDIWLTSMPRKGSTFSFSLPSANPKPHDSKK